jgi:hypothetical protein
MNDNGNSSGYIFPRVAMVMRMILHVPYGWQLWGGVAVLQTDRLFFEHLSAGTLIPAHDSLIIYMYMCHAFENQAANERSGQNSTEICSAAITL